MLRMPSRQGLSFFSPSREEYMIEISRKTDVRIA
jgi:hypothetical protein